MSYFSGIPDIVYEGPESKNPFAFKYYDPNSLIQGRPMSEHLRFAVAYWHTFTATGMDPFGMATMQRSWDRLSGMDLAKARVEAAFEFIDKLGVSYFTFHDRDIAPEGDTLRESNRNLDLIVDRIEEQMQTRSVQLLWNTSNLFSHPRFVHGAATSPNADVFAYAAAQVKKSLEIGKQLGGQNFVFWGGREGYETLLNTNMHMELDNYARFLHMALDYAKEIQFAPQFLIEPKPKEPTKHQYDTDAASAIAFLYRYQLQNDFKLNIEANHATLAGHTFQHELYFSRIHGMLGSVDANQGDTLLGWDTDEFPTNLYDTTFAMYEILQNGGLGSGGLNFDAKVRRASFSPEDLFYAHIAGMDAFAQGLRIADELLTHHVFESFIEERYQSWSEGIGANIISGKTNFKELEQYILDKPEIQNQSGRQEKLLGLLNTFLTKQF